VLKQCSHARKDDTCEQESNGSALLYSGKAASKGAAKAAIKGKTNKQAVTKPTKKKVDKRAVRPSATLAVPAARIRKIMREADEIAGMSADAIHTVGKAVVCVKQTECS
jgi:hypothetical protein